MLDIEIKLEYIKHKQLDYIQKWINNKYDFRDIILGNIIIKNITEIP